MAIEFDDQAGFDLTSVANPTKAQLIAAINESKPLPNRGGIIYQSITPDNASNPRFSRYIWLDSTAATPVLKVWTGAVWAVLPVAANSVIAASILNGAVIYNTKIGGFIAGDALKIIRVNSAFDALETVGFSSLLTAGSVPLTALPSTGAAPNYILKWNAAGTLLGYEPFSTSLIGANVISLTSLSNGASPAQLGFIVRANPATGVMELVSNDDRVSTLFPAGSATVGILPTKLSTFGASSKFGIRFNTAGAVWEVAKVVHQSADVAFAQGVAAILTEAHGLGGRPDTIELFLVNKANTVGLGSPYTVGDVIPVKSGAKTSGTSNTIFSSLVTPTTYTVGASYAGASTFALPVLAQTSLTAYTLAQLEADWNLRAILTRYQN